MHDDIKTALENGASLDDMPTPKSEKAWCKKHVTGYIGKDQFGNWYTKCYTGHKFNEPCEVTIEKGDENNG